jgi:hypothetical protein
MMNVLYCIYYIVFSVSSNYIDGDKKIGIKKEALFPRIFFSTINIILGATLLQD